jgi:hypothetical protein
MFKLLFDFISKTIIPQLQKGVFAPVVPWLLLALTICLIRLYLEQCKKNHRKFLQIKSDFEDLWYWLRKKLK